MTKPVTGLTTFASLSGSQPASLLDGAFGALAGAINEALSYSNGADDSGSVNAYVINFQAGVTVSLERYLRVQFVPQNTNTGPATANVAGTGDIGIVDQSGTALVGGELPAGRVVEIIFDGVNWQVSLSPLSGASGIPAGVILPYGGSMAPVGFLLVQGQAVSRTTYAALYVVFGITYGAGDGSTTFNLPSVTGRGLVGVGTGTRTYNVTNGNTTTGSPGSFTVPGNAATWLTGMPVLLTLTSGTITGLSTATTYYVIRNSTTSIGLASTLANSQNGVATNWSAKSSPVGTLVYTMPAVALGEDLGEFAHLIASFEMPQHSHSGGNIPPGASGTGANGQLAVANTGNAGGVSAMNIQGPSLGMNFIVKT